MCPRSGGRGSTDGGRRSVSWVWKRHCGQIPAKCEWVCVASDLSQVRSLFHPAQQPSFLLRHEG